MIGPDVAYQEIDGEYILLDARRGLYFGLKGVAAEIWRGLSGKKGLGALRKRLLRKFAVESKRLDRDLRAFVSGLRRKGLIR